MSIASVMVSAGLAQQMQKLAQTSAAAKTVQAGGAAQPSAAQPAAGAHHRHHHGGTATPSAQAGKPGSGKAAILDMLA